MGDDCILCGLTEAEGFVWEKVGWGAVGNCPRCGVYRFSEKVHLHVFQRPIGAEVFLSCATRQHWESTGSPLVLDRDSDKLAEAHSHTSVTDNLSRLLNLIGQRGKRPGHAVSFSLNHDFTLIDTSGTEEFNTYLKWLEAERLIDTFNRTHNGNVDILLTQSGWSRIQPSAQHGGVPGTCFVAMWIDPLMNNAYELGILPAVEEDCGLKALRVDRKQHNNQISDEIFAGIRGAQFVVADCTGHRQSVYYEAGFARGLGRDVIYCCQFDSFKARPFDTSGISHVIWDDVPDLRKKLADRIRATIIEKA